MYLFNKPSNEQITDFIESQTPLGYTYPSAGATRNEEAPPGFVVDHTRIQIGSGQATFEAAKRALSEWQHYEFNWIELHRPEARPESDQMVGILARALGLWVLNACRIVYVVEEEKPAEEGVENDPAAAFASLFESKEARGLMKRIKINQPHRGLAGLATARHTDF